MNVIGIIVVIGFACFAMGFILILAKILKALPRTNEGSVKLTNLNKKQKKLVDSAKASLEPVKKGKPKIAIKQEDPISEQKVYYISFNGDVMAKAVDNLKEEVNVILDVAKAGDEVLITLESPGGVVHGYGLAAAQLERFKKAGLKLTICVDKVAASGGYMMACVADEIIAAPFAILGSIGVVMEYPNFYNLLEKVGVEYQQLTAGKYKRTISPFMKPSDEGTEKAKTDLARTHELFKNHITQHRKKIKIEEVATGETWYGSECVANGLADSISTSDEVLLDKMKSKTVFNVKYSGPKKPKKLLSSLAASILDETFDKALNRLESSKFHK